MRYLCYILFGALLVMSITCGFEVWRISSLTTDLANERAENTRILQVNKQYSKLAEAQNKSIEDLKLVQEAQNKASAIAIAKATAKASQYAKKGAAIQSIKPSGNDCNDMKKVVDAYYGK